MLDRIGDYRGVISLQFSIIHYNDSISRKNIPLQISQLSKEYELDKAKIKEEKDQIILERTRILVLGLVAVFVLLVVILYMKCDMQKA